MTPVEKTVLEMFKKHGSKLSGGNIEKVASEFYTRLNKIKNVSVLDIMNVLEIARLYRIRK